MQRSPVLTSLALALGLSLALTLLWLLNSQPTTTVQAAPMANTIVVTTTIQAAIDAALPGDTISIPAGTYTEHLTVNKSLTFIGAGAGSTIVDGGNTDSVFSITSGDVSISDLTVQRGNSSSSGGGIYAAGQLTLTNVAVLSSTAGNGGGAYAGGAATLSGGLFQNNTCTGASCDGGGLYAYGTLT